MTSNNRLNLNRIVIAFIVSFISFATLVAEAQSKILLISDVDDTIKISHVRSTIDTGLNAVWDHQAFPGMARLYGVLGLNPEVGIYYVSNAPSYLMKGQHTRFLQRYQFPQIDHLITRPEASDSKFKFNTVMDIVSKEEPQLLLLIGDNGESDAQYFQMVRDALANKPIRILTFIHLVYSSKVEPLVPLGSDDFGYVTPVEISLHLLNQGILSQDQYEQLEATIVPKLLNDMSDFLNSKTFPDWLDCSDFQWPPSLSDKYHVDIEKIKERIKIRCS